VFERRDSLTDVKAADERQLEDLYAELGRLTTHVNFLKKATILSHGERRALVDHDRDALPLSAQAEGRGRRRRSLYYQLKAASSPAPS
jgi:putative transposase